MRKTRYYLDYFIYIVSRFPLLFVLYRGNFDYFMDSALKGSVDNKLTKTEMRGMEREVERND